MKRCTKCGETKPTGEFYKRPRGSLMSWCRACHRAGQDALREKNRAANADRDPYADPTPKRCPKCKESKLREDFGKNQTNKDGLAGRCRACVSSYNGARRAKNQVRWSSEEPDRSGDKRCPDCETTKPRSEFPINRHNDDGLHSICRPCVSARYSAWLQTPAGRRTKRAVATRRRARKAAAPVNDLTAEDVAEVWDWNDGRCVFCSEPAEETDHIVPLSKGGAHTAANVAPACWACNNSKSDATPDEWARRLFARLGLPTPHRLLAMIEEALDES